MGLSLTKATWQFCSAHISVALHSALFCLAQYSLSDLYAEKKGSAYNVLWALVFGFATLNILGLALRRFDPRRAGSLNFGEMLAIAVVFLSLLLLGLEMLGVFHILPFKLGPH